jgi:YYY domain-containing protein
MNEAVLVVRWYLVVQAFALAALPLCLWLFRHLPDRGYSVSKPFALVVTGWVFWLLGTLGWVHNTSGGIVIALAIVVMAGVVLYVSKRLGATSWDSLSWRSVLIAEAVFAVTLAGWCVVRANMPRIETAGGEKWMEIAFLRAILRSDSFPPHDPWLSGFAISYYYFGYIIVAMVTRLSAIPASIAFNLGIATLFALTCTGAYGIVSNLISAAQKLGEEPIASRNEGWSGGGLAAAGGLLGALLVAVVGNLEALFEVLHARGIGSASFWEWLDITRLAEPPVALAEGSWVPDRFIWWWQASRVVRDYTPLGGHQEVIDEFPAFSFLLGDMHPHVLGLPVVLLLIAMAFNLYLQALAAAPQQGTDRRAWWPFDGWEFALYAICLGGVGILNTWDFPIYLFVVAAAYALAHRASHIGVVLVRFARLFVPLLIASLLLYYPFWRGFQSQARGVLPNLLNGTRLPQLLVMFGPLLWVAGMFVVVEARRRGVRFLRVIESTVGMTVGIAVVLLLLIMMTALVVRSGVVQPVGVLHYVDAWLHGEAVADLGEVPGLPTLIRQRVLVDARLLGPEPDLAQPGIVARAALASPVWVVVGLLALLVALVLVLKRSVETGPAVRDFVMLLVAVATLLVLSVEFVYLHDQFGTRMNTIFKFYFQAWVLWAVAGAFGFVSLTRRRGAIRACVVAVTLPLVLAGLLFPALAIPKRIAEYGAPPTLDGAEYLSRSHTADYLAIAWLNENVVDAPVILETPGGGYEYEGRVSAHTGLPTVLGWAGHEWQWRGSLDEQNMRKPDIETIYSSVRSEEVLPLLDKYDISYVYVGPVERMTYPAEGLAKFDSLMQVAYQSKDVTIYVR